MARVVPKALELRLELLTSDNERSVVKCGNGKGSVEGVRSKPLHFSGDNLLAKNYSSEKRNVNTLEKIPAGQPKDTWHQLWFHQNTGKLSLPARIFILGIPVASASVIFVLLVSIGWLSLDDVKSGLNDAVTSAMILVPILTLFISGLGTVFILNEKIKFRNKQKQLRRIAYNKKIKSKNHRKPSIRSQIEQAVDLLIRKDPVARGLGVSRLTLLAKEHRIDVDEYQEYMAICRSWESPGDGKAPMVAPGAELQRANLREANLQGADLQKADLTGANLASAYLTSAYLAGANLAGAYLRGSKLVGADLTGADLTGASLEGANLNGANLQDTRVNNSRMTTTQKQLFADQKVNVEDVFVVEEPTG